MTQSAAPTTYTTLYVHDLDDHIIAETDTSGQTLREYIWLGDIPLAVVDKVATGSPVIYYVHSDHLGRPARMTAQNQAWVWDVIYSPFGETSYIWTNPGTIDIRFPGQWFQLESGLAYNWHRHYDASLGRYLQPDPLGLASLLSDGPSAYAYVDGNPASKVDPTGEFGLVGGVIGAGIDLGGQLLTNGGRIECVNWRSVGFFAVAGALTGGLADGAFAWKAGSNSWSATRKWLAKEVWNLQKGQEVHHWLIEQGSAIGKLIPNRIKNQPWNLNPMPSKAWHHFLHDLDPLTRKLLGAPGWAKGVGMGVGVSMVGASGDSCGCQ